VQLLEIAAFLEDQMGLIKGWLLGVPCTVTVYVSARRILGCLVVESIKGAFQAAPRPPAQPPQLLSCTSGGAAPSPWDKAGGCQTAADAAPGSAAGGPEPAAEGAPAPRRADGGISIDRSRQVKAMCGVRVMWTSVEARRQGLATKLLDCARAQVICGYVVPRAAVAFTQPTADGHAFIQRYTGASQFLVY
jgi:N-acetyltransferase